MPLKCSGIEKELQIDLILQRCHANVASIPQFYLFN